MENTTEINTACVEWLRNELLNKDVVLCDEIRKKCKEAGFSKKELKQARVTLGVETISMKTYNRDKDTLGTAWFWYLPKEWGDNA